MALGAGDDHRPPDLLGQAALDVFQQIRQSAVRALALPRRRDIRQQGGHVGIFGIRVVRQRHDPPVEGLSKGLQATTLIEEVDQRFHPRRLGTQGVMNHIHRVDRTFQSKGVRSHVRSPFIVTFLP